jgi:hypothetical protein
MSLPIGADMAHAMAGLAGVRQFERKAWLQPDTQQESAPVTPLRQREAWLLGRSVPIFTRW